MPNLINDKIESGFQPAIPCTNMIGESTGRAVIKKLKKAQQQKQEATAHA